MKNLTFIFILTFTILISSCKVADDNNSNPEDSNLIDLVVGTWQPLKDVRVCTGGNEIVDIDECGQKGRLTINSNGTYSESFYEMFDGNCTPNEEESGTWEIRNGKLFGDNEEVTFFEVEKNILRVGEVQQNGGPIVPCSDTIGGGFTHSYTELVRVQ